MKPKTIQRVRPLAASVAYAALTAAFSLQPAFATNGGGGITYTLDADFDTGSLVNVNHDAPNNDQLQLNGPGQPFEFIWVAASSRGTIVKIDTVTGDVLGEYRAAPEGRGLNPSRTTVDANGNVWTGNRQESGPIDGVSHGSVVKIGLEENGQCVDRNSNGTIETSTGLGDILDWPDITDGAGGTGDPGNDARVEDAEDECILVYQRVPDAEAVRHISVDGANNVWVGGYPFAQRSFHLLENVTGEILDSFDARTYDCGGYGGLVDGNGILWSASISQNSLLRYDPAADTGRCISVSLSYGLGIDTNGSIWNSMWTNNSIVKVDPAGVIQAGFPKTTAGASGDRGVAVTAADNNVWVASSGGSDVSRLDNDGNVLKVISVGTMPTGVAVDAAGKVWVSNLSSNNVTRIDPNGGGDGLGAVDLTVDLGAGAGPYNYSDMTGSTTPAAPTQGTWTVVYDTGEEDTGQCTIFWNDEPEGSEPAGTSITVQARAANAPGDLGGEVFVSVNNGEDPGLVGRYIEVQSTLAREAPDLESPVLSDLTILCNEAPICDAAEPSIDTIWPPNHKFVPVEILGVTDPDEDPIAITIGSIFQDEPVDTFGDGSFTPDGVIDGDIAELRAERSGSKKVPGNGRVYHVSFTAEDDKGAYCSAVVEVCVPHDQGQQSVCVDDGALYDSTID